ncbi:uncharacterized protein EAE97_009046 [Botrytis byssoidea]|uniref:Uncharacterized protein n=1 Tax=Botrytis byssoidea TaxID=139641 RepID=A0A9P5IB47_9HELO|nr:uncharacterized protein EAE97_009046 [Botrytis byssoidea]KAF7932025.1 hypothetical protein EAE97_009046 [Botrytis byssoidea]
MITLDVAAASAAFEAKVITHLRDEIAKAMASANSDINAQSEKFSKLFNARWPAENPDEFLQQFVKLSFGKAPSNVSQDKGKGKATDEAVASPGIANDEHTEDQDVIASGSPHSSLSPTNRAAKEASLHLQSSAAISEPRRQTESRPVPGLYLLAIPRQQLEQQPIFAILYRAANSKQIDAYNVPSYGRTLKQNNALPHCGGSGTTKPIGEQKSVNYMACILWPQPYEGVDTRNFKALKEFAHVEQFLDRLKDQILPAHLNIRDAYIDFTKTRAHVDGGNNKVNNGAMRDMGARQNTSAGPSRAKNNEKRSWDDRNEKERSYPDRKKRSY